MEIGRSERDPGYDAERANGGGDLEKLGAELSEKLRADMDPEFGRKFEAPEQFENEDAKNIAAEKADEARELSNQLTDIDTRISQSTQQLAALPLTREQQLLLEQINQLIAQRDRTKSPSERSALDTRIEETTRELAALPVTPEQGALLDDILSLMDQREKTSIKLQQVYSSNSK